LPSPTGSILAAQPQVLERPVRVAFLNGLNSDMDNFLKLENLATALPVPMLDA